MLAARLTASGRGASGKAQNRPTETKEQKDMCLDKGRPKLAQRNTGKIPRSPRMIPLEFNSLHGRVYMAVLKTKGRICSCLLIRDSSPFERVRCREI